MARTKTVDVHHIRDAGGKIIAKLLDLYEPVIFDQQSDITVSPHYYGDAHPSGDFMIREHSIVGGIEQIKFYKSAPNEDLRTKFADRASITYVDLWEVF